nr:TetM/TetW/TetO/TetS family tetracycline resistance ribosomal protection protein [uncultured Mediterraneibacter sp.]
MGNNSENKPDRYINIGIVAHVDAGKTTLSESMLYHAGAIRKLGRVDHKDAFLDTDQMERERGITIFSKQAVFRWKDRTITLLDTPGHVDFSAEMERVLQVLDCAVLVVSGADGVQGHTQTLWKLLKRYHIPTFLFVNKMDQEGTDGEKLLKELRKRFGENVVPFVDIMTESDCPGGKVYLHTKESAVEEVLEELAVCEDDMMEEYLEEGRISLDKVQKAVADRQVFPCYFGSALHSQGVEELLDGLDLYIKDKTYPAEFGAKVYKITRDNQGNRLTYLKVTGGRLKVKDVVEGLNEKINQIRIYSGEKFEAVQEVEAGRVCAVTGLENTRPGQGIGAEEESDLPVLEPVLTYQILLPDDCDVHKMLLNLKILEEEEPELHIVWEEQTSEIHVQLMGDVQIEILQWMIKERFGVLVEFGEGSIVYKETITAPVEGVGHFEPLRHYAEVHLRLEPGERGSGMQFAAECSEDILDRNWQRLVLTHLEEKEHKGVLTGSPITDMKITLTSGRAHQKHTEGGDFRQATYRAVRQGLKKADSILLEPYYEFRMELPSENVGRTMTDIQNMSGKFGTPMIEEETTVLTGSAPVSLMRGYQKEFTAYTGGRGRMAVSLKGYDICHNQEEVLAESTYDSEADLANPTGSVFCAHGAGFVVDWDEVEEYMHMEHTLESGNDDEMDVMEVTLPKRRHSSIELTQEELDAIYVRTPDPKKDRSTGPVTVRAKEKTREPGSAYQDPKWEARRRAKAGTEEYLLVDGYNIIFSWEELKELSERDIGAARGKLADILSNYQGFRKCTLILVYDAYKVEGNPGEVMKYHNIYIVYTKEAETADQYIEKTVRRIAKNADVTVATSDGLEQVIIMGQGAHRMSAPGLKEEVELALKELRGEHLGRQVNLKNYLLDYLDEETAKQMEEIRLGKEKC